jgi:hypothetical protein
VGDNATSNDAETILGLNAHPELNLNASHRIRCAGHIINLVVKATIYGSGVSKFEEDLARAAPMDQFKLFRQLGVVRKLHNFVNSVCASHKRRELFNSIQKEYNEEDLLYNYSTLQLRQDGGVRWHSVYLMLLRCTELQEPIKRFIRRLRPSQDDANDDTEPHIDEQYNPLTDGLTDDDWDEVHELVDFLQAPYEMTKRLEGNNSSSKFGSIWQTLVNLQALWTLYTTKPEGNRSKYMTSAVLFGKEKLDTYFDKLLLQPEVSFYAVATALHPRLRLTWFKTHWKNYPKWYKKAETSVRKVYKDYLDAEVEPEEQTQPPSRRKHPIGSSGRDLYSQTMEVDLMLMTANSSKRQRRVNELDEYFAAQAYDLTNASDKDLDLLNDPWAWWLQIGRAKYPVLFKIATDFLSIPSTSCDNERAFSKAKRTVTCDRNSLSGATIEAIQLQKDWLLHGVVKSSLIDIQQHVGQLDKTRR